MPDFIPVAKAADLAPGTGRCVEVMGKRIAVFNSNGSYFALDDACTHVGASLAEGSLEGDCVVCPWHGATFSLLNGAASGPPARGNVKAYPCRAQDGQIEVGL